MTSLLIRRIRHAFGRRPESLIQVSAAGALTNLGLCKPSPAQGRAVVFQIGIVLVVLDRKMIVQSELGRTPQYLLCVCLSGRHVFERRVAGGEQRIVSVIGLADSRQGLDRLVVAPCREIGAANVSRSALDGTD